MNPALAVARAGAAVLAPSGPSSRLSILIYHRVLPRADPISFGDPDAERFERELGWLRTVFNLIPLDEAIARMLSGSLPARPACITFDDGYADNAEVALPILKRNGVTATFFISTGFLNGGRMWNDTIIEAIRRAPGDGLDLTSLGFGRFTLTTDASRREAIKTLIEAHKYLHPEERAERLDLLQHAVGEPLPDNLMMRSDQVIELSNAGMTIGAHTMNHPILSRLNAGDARKEIEDGRELLAAIIRNPVELFAYPNGKPGLDYDADHVAMVKKLGFKGAVSTAWGVGRLGSDIFELPRFTPWDRTPARFVFRLVRNAMHVH